MHGMTDSEFAEILLHQNFGAVNTVIDLSRDLKIQDGSKDDGVLNGG